MKSISTPIVGADTRSYTALNGDLNGRGKEVGLIARVAELVDTLEEMRTMLKGKGEDPGMVGTLRQIKEALDKREDTEKWLFRLIGAYMALEIVKAVLPMVAN